MNIENQLKRSSRFATDSERWHAVTHRLVEADAEFVYAVKTTGVYCRPSCAARRALRRNVMFYNSCEEAGRAGFRPCKRCQPGGTSLKEEYAARISAACRVIDAAGEAPTLHALAKACGMSTFHFHRVFTSIIGLTPGAYARERRAERARHELIERRTVTEAIYGAGFNSNGRFYATSAQMLGMTPQSYRAGGEGESIRFAMRECSLGMVLVAASARGVCAIALGASPEKLVSELRSSFPRAKLIAGDRSFSNLVANVIAFIESPGRGCDLPLDVRGTAFQRRVWNALQKIPAGTKMTYTEVARLIGLPKAVRAVASACAANKIAVAIPCHRIAREDGKPSGYRWGAERKRKLMERERS